MIGIDPRRLEFFNLSAAQGPRWAEICTEFTGRISKMGPSPIWRALKEKQLKGGPPAEGISGGTAAVTDEGVENI